MITRRKTSRGETYFVGTFDHEGTRWHFRFFPNDPDGEPRLLIDGREFLNTGGARLPVSSRSPASRSARSSRAEKLAEAAKQVDAQYRGMGWK